MATFIDAWTGRPARMPGSKRCHCGEHWRTDTVHSPEMCFRDPARFTPTEPKDLPDGLKRNPAGSHKA
jgi:hypothetical protein